MDHAADAYAAARNNMVDGQLRPNRVTDRRVLAAMRSLKREAFVPAGQRALAYADADVPLGEGRVLLAPMVMARLVQAAGVAPGGKVLVLGAGYAAAVFAACGALVTAVEQDPARAAAARAAFAEAGVTVSLVEGRLSAGWAEDAPYDAILIDGAVTELPPLGAQLRRAPPGRLCAIVAPRDGAGVAVLAEPTEGGFAQLALFDCTATLLPALSAAPRFTF